MNNSKPNILKESLEKVFRELSEPTEHHKEKLLHNLLLTIERKKEALDWLIARHSRKVRGRTAKVLYWALVEILYMNGVPAPAVVDASVDFVKRHHSPSEASFVNAFLRSIIGDMASGGVQNMFAEAPRHVFHGLPKLLWDRCCANFGADAAEQVAAVLQLPAKVVLRRKTWPPRTASVPDTLLPFPAPSWAPWAELYTPAPSMESLDALMGGKPDFYIQDSATLLAPTLLAPRPGEEVADLCAAPGGKSLVLGEMMQGHGRLLCADRAQAKLQRLSQNLSEIPNAEIKCIDASLPLPQEMSFDAILLDVPCSNSGVIRRRPDVRSAFTKERITELVELQRLILENAANALKKSGRIVYSTCSIEPEENAQQVAAFLERHPEFRMVKSQLIMPSEENDGAYAALLWKE
ncbi:MAG: hypothetical protein IJS15_06105 [Victivallales bacterium]|nr:hypothetical protein [Victivallales bacterium]